MRFVPALALLVTLVAGCAAAPVASTSSSSVPNPSPSPAPTSTSTAAPSPSLTPQGFIPKKIGEQGGLNCQTEASCGLKFVVERIETNPACGQYGTKADAGSKTVVLHVSMSTGELSQDQSFYAAGIFNPFSMKGISPDGFVHDAKPGSCLDFTGAMPNQILPNSKYSGHVEVVLPESVTSIASASTGTGSKSRGWVWPIS
ncbi:hypothetical protein [Lentzea sp. CA-135723]|uniref:hypothetical protein n=1 Tax=Lentzea sp. CA-135723 TaxID=3239950 RepID=UPI003D8BF827